jgi:hypothetical protein
MLYVFIYMKAAIKCRKAVNGKFHMSQQKRNSAYCAKPGRSQLMPAVQNSGRKDALADTFFTVALTMYGSDVCVLLLINLLILKETSIKYYRIFR